MAVFRLPNEYKTNLLFVLVSIVLIVPMTYILNDAGTKFTTQLLFLTLPVILAGFINFRLALFIFIFSIFLEVNPYLFYSLCAFVVFYLLSSFVITNKGFVLSDLNTPFAKITLLFILTLLPSFFNSLEVNRGAQNMFHWAIFLLLISILSISLRDKEKINFLVTVYLSLITLNAFYSIYQGITSGRRAFGFVGIMYVDMLGIAIVVVFNLLLYAKGKVKLFYSAVFVIMTLSLIFTKTRNVWINTAIVLLLSLFHLIKKSGYLNIDKRKLLRYGGLSLLVIIISGTALISYFGTSFFRLAEKQKLTQESLETGDISNSLVTRYFIWSTGLNGFKQHPYIGIGMYSFPYTAKYYNTLPKVIFKKFVDMYSLHHGYYSILVEAGVVGFIGLLIYLSVMVKKTRKIYLQAQETPYFLYTFIAFWVLIYIIISLFFSDAWFWGRGIIIWGVVLGVISALNNLVKNFRPGEQI